MKYLLLVLLCAVTIGVRAAPPPCYKYYVKGGLWYIANNCPASYEYTTTWNDAASTITKTMCLGAYGGFENLGTAENLKVVSTTYFACQ